jgi:hypothetical protein
MFLDYFALTLLIVISIILIYAAIYIHDIPYEMAVKRNHPHQDAIHYGGWLSLFTLHAIWPFLWIWATLYRPETGYGFARSADGSNDEFKNTLAELEQTVGELQAQIHSMRSPASESEQPSATDTETANDGEQS